MINDYRKGGRCQQLREGPLHHREGDRRPGPRQVKGLGKVRVREG